MHGGVVTHAAGGAMLLVMRTVGTGGGGILPGAVLLVMCTVGIGGGGGLVTC